MHFLTLNSTIFHSLLKATQLLELGTGISLSHLCHDRISHLFVHGTLHIHTLTS